MEAGFSTLEMEVAENMGEDWEEMVDQRKYEIQRFEELGIPVPSWAQAEGFAPTQQINRRPSEFTSLSAKSYLIPLWPFIHKKQKS